MLGKFDHLQKKVTVIGGGFSGLLAAYYLMKNRYDVEVYEASERLGGLIKTEVGPLGFSETAAHSLLVTPAVSEFFSEIGVELVPVRKDSKARYVWRGGRPRRFPLTLWETVAILGRVCFVRRLNYQGRSVEEWVTARLGGPALRYLVAPMVRGIYGAHPNELSVEAAFPEWLAVKSRLKRHGRLQMMAPRFGMGSVVDALERRLRDSETVSIRTSSRVNELPREGNRVLAIPAFDAAQLLREENPELSEALSKVCYTPLTSVTIFSPSSNFKKKPRGVGVLMPDGETRECLGILYNSSSFPGRVVDEGNIISLTMIFEGIGLSDDALREAVFQELQVVLGIENFTGVILAVHRWKNAIPLYNHQVKDLWSLAEKTWCAKPGNLLLGNYTGKVSLRGMIETVLNTSFTGTA